MYGWGSTINGELGLGGVEEEHILAPTNLDWYLANTVVKAALGNYHTLLLTKDGKVYSCGSNDYGQLGHNQTRKRPRMSLFKPVSALDAHHIIDVKCGSLHSMALNQWGQVFSWGSNFCGQLGHGTEQDQYEIPKPIKALASYNIVQIHCGQRHSIALASSGEILTWGANNFGQLGLGFTSQVENIPRLLTSLQGVPIHLVTCGANHTFALSKSGAVYGWGKNTCGQLGLNCVDNKIFPAQLRTLRNIRVRYIACGDEFSMFLTLDGGVLTCGAGMFGQLGHGSVSNEILPRQIIELMGSTITQIACGKQHSLALVPSRGRVYSFGIGGCGQLGLRKTTSALTPQVVLGPWVSPSGMSLVPMSNDVKNLVIHKIFAGGHHCFVSVIKKDSKVPPFDLRDLDPATQIITLTFDYLKNILRISAKATVDHDVWTHLETAFKSLACINGSFLLENDAHYYCSSKHHGVDMETTEAAFSLIGKIENKSITDLIWNSIIDNIIPSLKSSPPDVEALRIYLTLPLYHEFNNPKQHLQLHKPFANAVLQLVTPASKVVSGWLRMMTIDYFERLVNIFKSVASFILRNQQIPEGRTAFYDPSLVAMLDLLTFLNKVNHSVEGLKVPYDTFHMNDLSEYLDVKLDYVYWLQDKGTGRLFLCNYSFVFDANAKLQLLETDQAMQMQKAMSEAAERAVIAMLLAPQTRHAINSYLVLNVTRENIVDDALRELSEVDPHDLKKPLRVKFAGEEAEDAGGVTKEFFLLLLRQILDPKYGMFQEYEETRAIWFSETSFEDNSVYFLIGMILGLAIYNFTIIDIPFPLALYKKLLGEPIGLADLKGLSPTLANSLQSLLDYKEDDLQDVFSLYFDLTRNIFGQTETKLLKPGGSDIPVTQENKHEYVDLYVNYIFNESVKDQYEAFHKGFMNVCEGRVLKLFHSHELMAVVIGNENYDWHALEEVAEYKNGYKSSDKTIRWFWEVIHEMSLADKKKFLLFLTGSYRIPIQGMKGIKIYIQPTNDEKFLPVAHTCFNLLDLPRYKTKERLKYKLMQAIQQTEGFSLV
ncbi:probable E3 ubiquitin-protein ligase HERC4 isoform X1 [Diorhabda carinulata]|uniref:probable E3 ubiquitin-protein ligase HERC4 isoform X1 n=1 Tax=Diorhabda carinulata TaxID=1163345 RepID=UPI0025A0EF25|nr:probable E3 ubiquitin-protein ligase HERC4 isoform X1 [Diorhabda carinulata]XP_057653180.1 probable E3 ubiquitin-protein ligase HERC4 isoform X1 [Diorhabda carinulata]XP_057653181.1 probable E3 ubiquitin-protein ligase HERC4 isoform X1 [Diorhabda carinulata]